MCLWQTDLLFLIKKQKQNKEDVKQEIHYEHNDFDSGCKWEDCIHFIPSLRDILLPKHIEEEELRNKWIRALEWQNKEKTEWKLGLTGFALSILLIVLMKQILFQL